MSNINPDKTFIPQLDGRALDLAKICAAVFMVADHVNALLLDDAYVGMYLAGRATFPLFCYALAVAVFKAGPARARDYSLKKYAPRLLLLAVLVEPVSLLTRDIGQFNVLFTLGLGAALAGACFTLATARLYLVFAALLAAQFFTGGGMEFGTAGIALPAILVAVLQGRRGSWLFAAAALFLINQQDMLANLQAAAGMDAVPAFLLAGLLVAVSAAALSFAALRVCALLPQDGRYLYKYALHIFYPGHMVLIWLAGRIFLA